jgi:hypothetical protein
MSVQHMLNRLNNNQSSKKPTLSNFSPTHIFITAGLIHWIMKLDKLQQMYEVYFWQNFNQYTLSLFIDIALFSIENIFLKYWVISPSRTRSHQYSSDIKFIAINCKNILENILLGFMHVFEDICNVHKMIGIADLNNMCLSILKTWVLTKNFTLMTFLTGDHYTEVCRFLGKIANEGCTLPRVSFCSKQE